MARFANWLLVALVVVCAACNNSGRERPPIPSRRDLGAEASALQLSQMCSTAAEAFWRRNGYDHPPAPAKGTTERWGYESHYNAEQKRCFVLVELVTEMPSGSTLQSQEAIDAMEGGEPLAAMYVNHDAITGGMPRISLLKANVSIPPTTENLEWFRGLMSK